MGSGQTSLNVLLGICCVWALEKADGMIWPIPLKTPHIQKAGWRLACLRSCSKLALGPRWPLRPTYRCCPLLQPRQQDPHLLLSRLDTAVSLGQGQNSFFFFFSFPLTNKNPSRCVLLGLQCQMCQEVVLVKQP